MQCAGARVESSDGSLVVARMGGVGRGAIKNSIGRGGFQLCGVILGCSRAVVVDNSTGKGGSTEKEG